MTQIMEIQDKFSAAEVDRLREEFADLMEKMRYTQREASKLVGCAQNHLSDFLRGENMGEDKLRRISFLIDQWRAKLALKPFAFGDATVIRATVVPNDEILDLISEANREGRADIVARLIDLGKHATQINQQAGALAAAIQSIREDLKKTPAKDST